MCLPIAEGEPRQRTQGSAGGRNDQALGEDLVDELPGAGAESAADGEFMAALGKAREEQVREVGAGHQED